MCVLPPSLQAAAGGVKEAGSRVLSAAEQAARGAYYRAQGGFAGQGCASCASCAARCPCRSSFALDAADCGRPACLPATPSCAGEEMVCVPISQVKGGALTGSAGVGAGAGALLGLVKAAAVRRLMLACPIAWQAGLAACRVQLQY